MRTILVAVALLACGCLRPSGKPGEPLREQGLLGIYRYHDDAAGVTCWTFKQGYAGGISCLPDSQIRVTK